MSKPTFMFFLLLISFVFLIIGIFNIDFDAYENKEILSSKNTVDIACYSDGVTIYKSNDIHLKENINPKDNSIRILDNGFKKTIFGDCIITKKIPLYEENPDKHNISIVCYSGSNLIYKTDVAYINQPIYPKENVIYFVADGYENIILGNCIISERI